MTLELNKVVEQIDDMGRVLAQRAQRQRKALPDARELLHRFAGQIETLRAVAESEAGRRLRCAGPGEERLDARFPAPAMPGQLTLVAVDGSQIFPNHHGLAFYYALNLGSIIFRHGSGQAPEVATIPRLFYDEQYVYPDGVQVTSDLVSAERDLAEMQELSNLTLSEACADQACVALADGPLLLWLHRANLPPDREAQILADYLLALDRLRQAGATVCGFVSRPHSAEVVALLYLAALAAEERQAINSLTETEFRGLTDRALLGYLAPGERSALFVRGTAANQDFRARGHSIYFFYLNTGSDLARVEVPEWVAFRKERLDLVHAAIYAQCQFNNGYPYVLTRADEQAVIMGEERKALEALISRAMAQHGLPLPMLSPKAQQKGVARWRRTR